MPMLNMRYAMPDHLIDLNLIPELAFLRRADSGLDIGAMTRQQTLERAPEVLQACPLLAEALAQVGHFQTRNRGTIGGSLSHLDPAAELLGVATALDARLTIEGPRGRRTLSIHEWPVSFMTPNIEPDEVVTAVTLPDWAMPFGHAFVEFSRRHGDFAIVGVACQLALDGGGQISRVALALVGVDYRPVRLAAVEQLLLGQPAAAASFQAAAEAAGMVEAMADAQITASYRQRLASVLTRRALERATERAASARAGGTAGTQHG